MRSDGSSPRLRGTRLSLIRRLMKKRFIPAPAGNTPGPPSGAWGYPVHPRACGEHIPPAMSLLGPGGSSPRLRGTPQIPVANPGNERFIPAPAGNTLGPSPCGRGPAVHPRACGEHPVLSDEEREQFGSSPRLRGTLTVQALGPGSVRFIPAPAGNTLAQVFSRRTRSVHPRACGEHLAARSALAASAGSSPRLRGTPCAAPGHVMQSRFIPAPAGNTRVLNTGNPQGAVHPRACGEHSHRSARGVALGGSSPRLRGTRWGPFRARMAERFIPAPAGNTASPG